MPPPTRRWVDDSTSVASAVAEAGGDVTLRVAPGVFHVWHATAGLTPEGTQAMAEVGAFLAARLS